MNVLDLFSGIGGFSLGLERAGMRTVAFCEIDPYARAVLAKHWPGIPCYPDVCELSATRLSSDGIGPVDIICGGFPCQDISIAWNGPGLAGERSGLWREYARMVGELRPRYVIVENVSALLSRGIGEVLGDLAAFGYDAEWHCIPASHVGAPHQRDRIWITAYPMRERARLEEHRSSGQERESADALQPAILRQENRTTGAEGADPGRKNLANTNSIRCDEMEQPKHGRSLGERTILASLYAGIPGRGSRWLPEPDVGRVANGVPARVDRLRCLGNAVVPQIPEIIGRAIMTFEASASQAAGEGR